MAQDTNKPSGVQAILVAIGDLGAAIQAVKDQMAQNAETLARLEGFLAKPHSIPAPTVPAQVPAGDVTPDTVLAAWRQTFGENLGPKAQDILLDAAGGDLALIQRGITNVAEGIASGKSQKPNKPLAYVASVIRRIRDGHQTKATGAQPQGYPKGVQVIRDEDPAQDPTMDEDLPF